MLGVDGELSAPCEALPKLSVAVTCSKISDHLDIFIERPKWSAEGAKNMILPSFDAPMYFLKSHREIIARWSKRCSKKTWSIFVSSNKQNSSGKSTYVFRCDSHHSQTCPQDKLLQRLWLIILLWCLLLILIHFPKSTGFVASWRLRFAL